MKSKNKIKFKDLIKFKNKKERVVFIISFLITISFFILQRSVFSWDFAVYVMNSEYFLYGGKYFEWLRPPLASFIISLFRVFGRKFAEYSYTIFCSILYFFSLKVFHNKFLINKKNSEIFYLFAINPFILMYGVGVGTEILSLSLIILFITFSFSYSSFIFLGLSMLTRYSNVVLFPLVFFSKNIKKILISILILLTVSLPWFIINYIYTGHALTSFADYYALNMAEQCKPKITIQVLDDFLQATNILLIFSLFGILNISYFKKRNKLKIITKKEFIMLIVLAVFTLLTYLNNPIKHPRFLFNLSFLFVYLSTFGFNFILDNLKNEKKIYIAIFLSLLLVSLSTFPMLNKSSKEIEKEENSIKIIIKKMDDLKNNCMTSSNRWVYFNYYGREAIPSPRALKRIDTDKEDFLYKLDRGYNIILFKSNGKDASFVENKQLINNLSQEYIVEDNEDYIWIKNPNSCKKNEIVNGTYIDSLKPFGEFPQDYNPCLILPIRFICHIKFL